MPGPPTAQQRRAHPEAGLASPGAEEPLAGPGAGGGTVRVGDTVRRAPERTPEAMRLVLDHLQAVGFGGAPRVLGRDDRGRWALSYVPGDVALPPCPAWAASDRTLASVARLLRRYHDAVRGFAAPPATAWPRLPPPGYEGDVIGHLDVSHANVVCRDGEAVALIDFEELGPTAGVWDVARTVRHWVPLLSPHDLDGALRAVDGRQPQRVALFADAYGLDAADRARLVDAALLNADESHRRMRDGHAAGHPGYAHEWTGGAAARNRRARAWIEQRRDALDAALLE